MIYRALSLVIAIPSICAMIYVYDLGACELPTVLLSIAWQLVLVAAVFVVEGAVRE